MSNCISCGCPHAKHTLDGCLCNNCWEERQLREKAYEKAIEILKPIWTQEWFDDTDIDSTASEFEIRLKKRIEKFMKTGE